MVLPLFHVDAFTDPTVHADRRFVDNGRVICSAGITAGVDMSLHVVGRLLGWEVADKTARQMEYPLAQPAGSGRRLVTCPSS